MKILCLSLTKFTLVLFAITFAANSYGSSCPSGSFYDATMGGSCWKCPAKANRTMSSVHNTDACIIPSAVSFKKASSHGKGKGLLGTDCGRGQFWDPNGYCYSCPAGFKRTGHGVTSNKACSKMNKSKKTSATLLSNMVDGPACKGRVLNKASVRPNQTIIKPNASSSETQAEAVYEFHVDFNCGSKKTQKARSKALHLLVGLNVDPKKYDNWKTDGCSGPMIKGDKTNWFSACMVHDYIWEFIPPPGKKAEWKELGDRALKINAAWICKQMWPKGSPGLGGCFDGARNTYNHLINFGAESYESNQQRASYTLTQQQYDAYKKYIDANDVPDFGTDWNPDTRGVFIK